MSSALYPILNLFTVYTYFFSLLTIRSLGLYILLLEMDLKIWPLLFKWHLEIPEIVLNLRHIILMVWALCEKGRKRRLQTQKGKLEKTSDRVFVWNIFLLFPHSSRFLLICWIFRLFFFGYRKSKDFSEAGWQSVVVGCDNGTHFSMCAGSFLWVPSMTWSQSYKTPVVGFFFKYLRLFYISFCQFDLFQTLF